jgi:acyl carrier protein
VYGVEPTVQRFILHMAYSREGLSFLRKELRDMNAAASWRKVITTAISEIASRTTGTTIGRVPARVTLERIGLDSIARFKLAVELEKRLNVRFNEKLWGTLSRATVDSLVRAVADGLSHKKQSPKRRGTFGARGSGTRPSNRASQKSTSAREMT